MRLVPVHGDLGSRSLDLFRYDFIVDLAREGTGRVLHALAPCVDPVCIHDVIGQATILFYFQAIITPNLLEYPFLVLSPLPREIIEQLGVLGLLIVGEKTVLLVLHLIVFLDKDLVPLGLF